MIRFFNVASPKIYIFQKCKSRKLLTSTEHISVKVRFEISTELSPNFIACKTFSSSFF